jgi:hypothetical protein
VLRAVSRVQWVDWCVVGRGEVASNDPAAEGAMLGTVVKASRFGPTSPPTFGNQLLDASSSMGFHHAPLPRS